MLMGARFFGGPYCRKALAICLISCPLGTYAEWQSGNTGTSVNAPTVESAPVPQEHFFLRLMNHALADNSFFNFSRVLFPFAVIADVKPPLTLLLIRRQNGGLVLGNTDDTSTPPVIRPITDLASAPPCDVAGEPLDHIVASQDPGPWPDGPFELHDREFSPEFYKRSNFFVMSDLPPPPSPRLPAFSVPMPIPPVLVPTRQDEDTYFFQLTLRESSTEIIPGKKTPIWGFDGMYPGPTICVPKGSQAVVRQLNHTNVDVTIHRHGGDQPGLMDGHPMDLIKPGESKDYHYAQPDQRHLWYHDHTMGKTGPHVYHGMAGFYLIEDPIEHQLGLPMGENKIPIAVTDKIVGEDGRLIYPVNFQTLMEGVMGDIILVNGAPQPYFEVGTRKMRFIILNSSTARVYEFALSNGQPLVQVGSGAGLLEAPQVLSSIELGPSDRADIIIDFSQMQVGDEVVLKNLLGYGSTEDILRFDVVRREADESVVPSTMPEHEPLQPSEAVAERMFVFEMDKELEDMEKMWLINGEAFDPEKVYARPKLGTTEIWTLVNNSGQPHPFHTHLVEFQILSKNFETPADPDLLGVYDDSLLLHPGQVVKIIMKWQDFPGMFVLHCHNSEHEDHSMMMQYEVVE